jgi:hypothetical protein
MSNSAADWQTEVDDNLEFFLDQLPKLSQKVGKFALLRERAIAGFFDTPMDAVSAGKAAYPSKPFSIQQITETPVDLGFYSHAGDMGKSR